MDHPLDDSQEIQAVKTQTASIVTQATDLNITDDFTLNQASIVARDIQDTKKAGVKIFEKESVVIR